MGLASYSTSERSPSPTSSSSSSSSSEQRNVQIPIPNARSRLQSLLLHRHHHARHSRIGRRREQIIGNTGRIPRHGHLLRVARIPIGASGRIAIRITPRRGQRQQQQQQQQHLEQQEGEEAFDAALHGLQRGAQCIEGLRGILRTTRHHVLLVSVGRRRRRRRRRGGHILSHSSVVASIFREFRRGRGAEAVSPPGTAVVVFDSIAGCSGG